MNNIEKKVIKFQLDKEQAALDDLERQYKRAIRDIEDRIKLLQSDELTQSRVYQIQYQKALKGQIEGILDKLQGDEYATIQQYLHDSYQDSFIGTMYSLHGQGIPLILPIDQDAAVKAVITDSQISEGLYNHLGVNIKQLKQAIRQEVTRGIAANMPFADIARNIANRTKAPLSRAKTIVRTEGHRIQQASANDARNAAKANGCNVVKQWDGTLDGDTRPTHRRLDGQIRETNEPFEMDGKKAMYPGDFGKAEEDCNCRCVALTRAKWALDEDELKALKERAKFFEVDKKDDFETFEKKYLKANEAMKKSEDTETAVNKRGEAIIFDEKLNGQKWAENVQLIKRLSGEYDTRLSAVGLGARNAAGDVDMGGKMRLSTTELSTTYHEFAHTIAMEELTKYGVEHDEAFWKEIKSVRRRYMKEASTNPALVISHYEHSSGKVNEFMAEAFAHAKMAADGVEIPDKYGKDFTYSNQVLDIVDKYFRKNR